MKAILELAVIIGLVLTTYAYAETKAPDDVVTKADINKCLKHLRKTEDFLYPNSLKIESAHYKMENAKVLLTLNISEKTEYGGSAGVKEKQCVLDKDVANTNVKKQKKPAKQVTTSTGGSYGY